MSLRAQLLLPVLAATVSMAAVQLIVQGAIGRAYVHAMVADGWGAAHLSAWVLQGLAVALTLGVGCAVGTIIDRVASQTERALTQATQAQAVAEADRTALLAALGHDFRTPLHGVMGSLELLDDDLSPEDRQALMDAATESSLRLASLIEDLLDGTPSGEGPSVTPANPSSTTTIVDPRHAALWVTVEGSPVGALLAPFDLPLTPCTGLIAAQATLQEHAFELVIAEVAGRDLDGVGALRDIADERGRLTAFVAIARPQDRDAALAAGWDDVLVHGERLPADVVACLERWNPGQALAS